MNESLPKSPLNCTNPILVVILFISCVWAGDQLLATALSELQLTSGFRYSRLYRGEETAQVVTIGNSRGVNSFLSPALSALTGKSVLNLSYNGMSCPLAHQLLNDYLEHNKEPELLVIEPTCVFAETKLLNAMTSYFRHSNGLKALHNLRHGERSPLAELSALYQFNNELSLRSFYYLGRSDQNWVNDYTVSAALLAKVAKMKPITEKNPADGALTALKKMVDLAKSRGVAIKFIIGPYLPAYRAKLAYWPALMSALRLAVGPDVAIEDHSLSIDDPTQFADRVHLNRRGAVALGELFVKDGVFESHNGKIKPGRRL